MVRANHPESHRTRRIGWLRASVLGANDGIVSTASLVVGVAGWGLTVAAETYDGWLNDVNGHHVRPEHVYAAFADARSGPIEEGSVGGGTGMSTYQFKGGSGTSSRRLTLAGQTFHVGAFVQSNFGKRHLLQIAGIPMGHLFPLEQAVGLVDFLKALLMLLALFLLLGYAKPADLRRQMPYQIIAIIASSLVISEVMVSTGTGERLAGWLLTGAQDFGPYWALALVLLTTWALTELMSNNAAAALAFPVALGVAARLGLDPQPFVMAVLYGASCSFLTPYGYQTNLMIMSPGRYTLADFVRAGTPVALVFLAVALLAIPVVFPFK